MKSLNGVADGTRTHDNQDHNLGLYQLSYSHRLELRIIAMILGGATMPFRSGSSCGGQAMPVNSA